MNEEEANILSEELEEVIDKLSLALNSTSVLVSFISISIYHKFIKDKLNKISPDDIKKIEDIFLSEESFKDFEKILKERMVIRK
jgi:hypothetical protein